MRAQRMKRVELGLDAELVAEIDACRADMPRATWIASVLKLWLGYRLDVEILGPGDELGDDVIVLSQGTLEEVLAGLERGQKPEKLLKWTYGLSEDDRLVICEKRRRSSASGARDCIAELESGS
jgi:hypothetical protein